MLVLAHGLALAGGTLAAGEGTLAAGEGDARPRLPHPWASDLADRPPLPAVAPRVGPLDALEVTLGGRLGLPDGAFAVTVRARYRLDAHAHLARLAADAHDLDELHDAHTELARRERALAMVAERCTAAWRGWQAAVVEAAATRADDDRADEELATLLALLRTFTAQHAGRGDVVACRLEPWTSALELMADAPQLRIAAAQERLGLRSQSLATTAAPPAAWLELDLVGGRTWPAVGAGPAAPSITVRGGLEVPFDLVGSGSVGVEVGVERATLTLAWRSPTLHERVSTIAPRGPRSPTVAADERALELERRRLEARLHRLDADVRWRAACGDGAMAVVIACLGQAVERARTLRNDLMDAIDAELRALHALLAAVDASGASLAELLAAPAAVEPDTARAAGAAAAQGGHPGR